jgi:predicted short-subunit dehydrogenase-like oxidoreductase (DUF2520 family)
VRELERDQPETAGPEADTHEPPRLVIVGRGRVGGAVATAAERAGIGCELAGRGDIRRACSGAGAVLLCVGDADIRAAAAEVAGAAAPPPPLVGHTSGATGLGALAPATALGASAFSLHPLQTVPGPDADLAGAPCAVAGSDLEALAYARELAEALGMRPFEVSEEARAGYHAAAAMASNFLITLEESAAEAMEAVGIADARELLAPLVLRSAENWAERGRDALTGPIARGDEETVARHVEALRSAAPELVALYETLAERTREIARAR